MIASATPKSNTPAATFRRNHDAGRRIISQAAAISSTAAHLLRALHDHANAAGECWPRQRTLADETGLSLRTIRRVTRLLEQHGLIEVTPGCGHRASRYVIRYPETDRGKSPVEYNRPERKPQPKPQPRPFRRDRGVDLAQEVRTIGGIMRLADRYRCSQAQVILALQKTRERKPDNFGAYLRRVLERHRDRQSLLELDRETIMGCRAELARLERQGAA